MKQIISYDKVRELLPQEYPFIFIDFVTDFNQSQSIICIKNLTGNESFFQGHFPQNAIFPGVLILESMAQSAILLNKLSSPEKSQDKKYMLAGTKVRFLQTAIPGDQLKIETEMIKETSGGGIVKSSVWVADKMIAKADLTFAISSQEKINVKKETFHDFC
ncbi:3-hydroxyacyl-ACP dehydratase FabZ [Cytobacillus purgationiresistens]|uniref:3-hydroxyacyl-[acyl-carrier-protein] dehydratase n=1 Tax=Cytobacillus purgationiresistens TaxID=863449 RepID=A0ABU0ANY9_9BACI|nr:3-hydroxyacyl-ACP dehydratase FabZ [Cytobacillus purgationiresistens]MDQ0272996.1 3-hydroxyacyl-[acyl-carrier-protein] dehydratase [Cytobacillus purgationiresistens]